VLTALKTRYTVGPVKDFIDARNSRIRQQGGDSQRKGVTTVSLVSVCYTKDFGVIASDGRALSPRDCMTPVDESVCKFLALPGNLVVAATGTSDFDANVFRESVRCAVQFGGTFETLARLLRGLIDERKKSGGRPCAALLLGQSGCEIRANSWSTSDAEHEDLPTLESGGVGIPTIGYPEVAEEAGHLLARQLAPLVPTRQLTPDRIISTMQAIYDDLALRCPKINRTTFFHVLRVQNDQSGGYDGGGRGFLGLHPSGYVKAGVFADSNPGVVTSQVQIADGTTDDDTGAWYPVATVDFQVPADCASMEFILTATMGGGTSGWVILETGGNNIGIAIYTGTIPNDPTVSRYGTGTVNYPTPSGTKLTVYVKGKSGNRDYIEGKCSQDLVTPLRSGMVT
jgi:hypothetical protein